MPITFTPLAGNLIATITANKLSTSTKPASLFTPINYSADIYNSTPGIITANYGFDGYIGVPGIPNTDSESQAAALKFNVAWEYIDPSLNLNAGQRAYTSAADYENSESANGVAMLLDDTIPVVFSMPVLPTTVNTTDFAVTLNDGSVVTPVLVSMLPNLEYNERQTIVLDGDFGNRLQPGQPGSMYPISVTIVNDGTPLQLLSATGPVSIVGATVASSNPYVAGNGPKLVGAKLNRFSDLGEGAPAILGSTSIRNSGGDLYGADAQYRLRLYTSAGFSPDGIASLLPSDYSNYFILRARDERGNLIPLTLVGTPYTIGTFGTITVVGLADLTTVGTPENAAYIGDHDNYFDVILKGDLSAIERLADVRMPSSGSYKAVYNPGGPGNNPTGSLDNSTPPPGPFTVASSDHTIAITNDLNGSLVATYVETGAAVMRDPYSGQPIGTSLGAAVIDTVTGATIWCYQDPNNAIFYASFAAASAVATNLAGGLQTTTAINLLNTTSIAAGTNTATLSGSISREASLNSTLRFYTVLDSAGTVVDPLISGGTLRPSDGARYRAAALSSTNLVSTTGSSIDTSNGATVAFSFSADGGKLYAPVLSLDNGSDSWFAFGSANSDGLEHLTSFGANVFGCEDLKGGGDLDFDDLIVRFSVAQTAT